MSYNMKELPKYLNTAGKITVITALLGVVVFAVIFLLNIGAKEFRHVEAQGLATTTVTVLNTPPQWTVDARESVPSSTTTPTNAGSVITWIATATDSNAENYYLLICSASTTPTANAAAAPTCGAGAKRWAVSASSVSGTQTSAATTTTAVAPFAEQQHWVAWVCDSTAVNPRCNATFKQGNAGTFASTSSPFNVNHRPVFTAFWDDSPKLPGQSVIFHATSSDPDVVGGADTVRLKICSTNSFSGTACGAVTLASSTFSASNPTATYPVPIPTQDQNYGAFGFVYDNHGFEALGGSQGSNSVLTVSNAVPTVAAGTITLNNGANLVLTQEATQTPNFRIRYTATDNNSCVNASAGNEIVRNTISVYRSGIGSTTCNGNAGTYNANNCYPSRVGAATWNLSCTASSTSCTGNTDTTQIWDCTFPLWYIADPTDGGALNTVYFAEDWRAGVSAIDDNSATSSFTQSSIGQEVNSFMALSLTTLAIPYGALQPGEKTDPLAATTTVRAVGNVGLDELLTGKSMCTNFTNAVACRNSATSTVAESNQVFATSSITYAAASSSVSRILSSTTQKELELNVKKSTSTTFTARGVTYWGIRIPGTITLAGSYTGNNTIYGTVGEPTFW